MIQHTNDSLHTTHDKAQVILAELASLSLELLMRIGESWLIEPMLPYEETKNVIVPNGWHKQEHQANYALQCIQRLFRVCIQVSVYCSLLIVHTCRKQKLFQKLLLILLIELERQGKCACFVLGMILLTKNSIF